MKRILITVIIIGTILIIVLAILLVNLLVKSKKSDSFSIGNDIIFNNNRQYTALYINLENRKDRKNHIENGLKKVEFNNFSRFNAILDINRGYIGCSKSHLECLKLARENNYSNVIIFEDDFEFTIDKDEFNYLLNYILNIDYDVFMLSYNTLPSDITETQYPILRKIKNTQTASGYIVKRKYYDKLISNYEEALTLLEKTDNYSTYANDQYWKSLQKTDNWLCYKKRVGIQIQSFSDIAKTTVNYKV
jgi:glycosyl transferase family 25